MANENHVETGSSLLMEEKKSRKFQLLMVLVLICAISSILVFINYSSRMTKNVVRDISEFYLEEIADNVSSVCKSHFDGYFKELRLALMATAEVEISSEEALEAHMRNMEERGEFLFYALMAEDGTVYLSNPAYESDFLVDFLRGCGFDEQEVTMEVRENEENIVIIALEAPEDSTIMGKRIVGGAKGLSVDKVRQEILLRNEDNVTFSHMIRSDGTFIIAGENPVLSSRSENYFSDMKNVRFEEGYSLEKMMADIQAGNNGSTAFYGGERLYYAYYVHLSRSGWALVLTLPYDVVSAVVAETADGVTFGGVLLALGIGLLLGFVLFSWNRQKKATLLMNLKRIEAEERNHAKSSFLSSMSHDIRTPMNAIIGFTNLAIQQDNNQKTSDYLMKIQTASNHLLSLINDVLDMSRIESGKMNLDETKCNLAEIFHSLHSIIQGQVHAKQQLLMDVLNGDK